MENRTMEGTVSAAGAQRIDIRIRLSVLWIAAMFCYIYADIIAFYDPWLLNQILEGYMGFWPLTQGLKLGVAILMSVPALMAFLSLALRPRINRRANITFGAIKTMIILATLFMSPWYYYMYFAVLEIGITSYIVWTAWRWPTTTVAETGGG